MEMVPVMTIFGFVVITKKWHPTFAKKEAKKLIFLFVKYDNFKYNISFLSLED